jgi:hypothetical protein
MEWRWKATRLNEKSEEVYSKEVRDDQAKMEWGRTR